MRPAIVLAAFGTTAPDALPAIFAIQERVEAAFPRYDVHLAFTSNIIRRVWRERAADPAFRQDHPDVPERVYGITNVLSTLAAIQETGARPVLVQSLHVTDGEEYQDLAGLVRALAEYRTVKATLQPFPRIGLGEPALGVGDGQPAPLGRAAEALRPLVERARRGNDVLVLIGHGNEHLNQTVFAKLQDCMRTKYGEHVYIGTVEAPPFADDIAAAIKQTPDHPQSILLAPLMVVAGDHAQKDMAGDEDDSWLSVLMREGFTVEPHLVGLGANPSWADIYVEHLKAVERTVLSE